MKTTKSLTIVGGNKNSYLTEYKKESWKSIFTQKVEVSHMHISHCCIFYAQRLQPLCTSFTLLIHQQLVCYYEINFPVRCLDTNKKILNCFKLQKYMHNIALLLAINKPFKSTSFLL
jgi:hypothetical protein